ncbi:uncharacterized protein LOC129939804 [Eupeodes corollae]|uniref:uncharacterized protein LOC129939804 n=1 Tax=Eupeodes corollae TaxID=290404 RepID=UPI0024924941|nr:uncharacterized protein LOC129939804 [Eupeodes corollae]XP_055903938.1 uncharacterized protein LOC129939804 [Eupeodes corollae]
MIFNLYTLFLLITSAAVSLAGTYLNRNDLPLSSKVIFQSPMMENVYKDIVLSSKPINLKKYATAKPKNSPKDSKIYYIPIGPMPYHFAPVVNGNQQPLLPPTNPILNGPNVPPNFLQAFLQSFQQNPPQNYQQNRPQINYHPQPNYIPSAAANISPNKGQIPPQNVQLVNTVIAPSSHHQAPATPSSAMDLANTNMIRLNGHTYYFNGRPYRLKAYRAAPKLNVDKYNLNSHLFFNKNIIY